MSADDYTMFRIACLYKRSSIRSHARRLFTTPRDIRRALVGKKVSELRDQLLAFTKEAWADIDRNRSPREFDSLRLIFADFLRTAELSIRKASNKIGINFGALSDWRRGVYKGNNARIADKVRRYLESQGVVIQ